MKNPATERRGETSPWKRWKTSDVHAWESTLLRVIPTMTFLTCHGSCHGEEFGKERLLDGSAQLRTRMIPSHFITLTKFSYEFGTISHFQQSHVVTCCGSSLRQFPWFQPRGCEDRGRPYLTSMDITPTWNCWFWWQVGNGANIESSTSHPPTAFQGQDNI